MHNSRGLYDPVELVPGGDHSPPQQAFIDHLFFLKRGLMYLVWLQTHYIAEDDLELLTLLPLPFGAEITGK